MKKLILTLLLLFAISAYADPPHIYVEREPNETIEFNIEIPNEQMEMARMVIESGAAPACADSSCTGFLVCQNFENTVEPCTTCAEDNSETWTLGHANVNIDYTDTILRGTQSLYISGSGYTGISPTFAETSEIWVHFLYRTSDATPSSADYIFRLRDSANNDIFQIGNGTAGAVFMKVGSNIVAGSYTMSDNTTYHIFGYYKAGTGANAVGTVWAGTSSNRASCTQSATKADSDATASVNKVLLYASQQSNIFDQILVDNAEFTQVCD